MNFEDIPFITENLYELIGIVSMNGDDGLRAKQLEELIHALHVAMSASVQIVEVAAQCLC